MNNRSVCLACEREKAKLPTYGKLAKDRAVIEGKTMVVYLDEEDIKFRITDLQTALDSGFTIESYYTPFR